MEPQRNQTHPRRENTVSERDELACKIRWASKKSTSAEQARDAAEALLAAGYGLHPEKVGEVEKIGTDTARIGDTIVHRGVTYRQVQACGPSHE
jgi:hypothetical protein